MTFDGAEIYELAWRLGMPELERAARGAGVISVLEIAVLHSGRLRHSVARAIESQLGEVELRVAYEGLRLGAPLRTTVDRQRMERLNAALLAIKFGQLSDQSGLGRGDAPLWLLSRASGSHAHRVLLAPGKPEPPWSAIVQAVQTWLPEAIREIPLR